MTGRNDAIALETACIVERLRGYYDGRVLPTWGEIREAADEIERLQGIIDKAFAHRGAAQLREVHPRNRFDHGKGPLMTALTAKERKAQARRYPALVQEND